MSRMAVPTGATEVTTNPNAVTAAKSAMRQESKKYTMRRSRLTVDKLGIQMGSSNEVGVEVVGVRG